MEESKIKQFVQLYQDFLKSGNMESRNKQIQLVPTFREIIEETLKNDPLENKHLTGLIQMLGAGSKTDTFQRYLKDNVKNSEKRDKILAKFKSIGETGFTGRGLQAIASTKQEELKKIKLFLKEAFSMRNVEQGMKLTKEFNDLKIPQITPGIYSPWLYYINPEIFPIINNSTIQFRKWLGMPSDYPSFIESANQLISKVNETDHGRLDWFAHLYGIIETEQLDIGDRKFFKVSHGSFINYGPFKKTGILKILEEKNWIAMGNETGLNQFDTFSKEARIGDYVYVCYGGKSVYAIGQISSEVKNLNKALNNFPSKEEWSYREINLLFKAKDPNVAELTGEKKNFMPGGNSTFWEVPWEAIADMNEKIFIPKFGVKVLTTKSPGNGQSNGGPVALSKNIILYGPPGTGKTYNTINKSLEIIGVFDRNKSREEIKEIFQEKCKQGQIVFTTFHQSLSYEDFIEGIKPLEPEKEGDPISYKVQPGIFQSLCVDAAFSISLIKESKETENVLDFSLAYDAFTEELEEKLAGSEPVTLETKTGGRILLDSISQQGNIIIMHKDGNRKYTISKARLSKLHKAIKSLDEVSNINDQFREIIGGSNSSAYWSVLNAIRKNLKSTSKQKERRSFTWEEKKEVVQSMKREEFRTNKAIPFVLIIDEINRGNVSQIFGELITLIEADKRAGMPEALEIVLPYSKENFFVPPNLYILGTMNTADRSVEALDTALRRRFSFVEMMPDYSLLENEDGSDLMIADISLKILLQKMNERLCYLLDEDHQIGHSFFLSVEDEIDLRNVFKNNIIPQLKEFFYNDHSKIRLVLGDGFVKKIEGQKARPRFAADDEEDFVLEKSMYKIREINDDFEILEAVRQML